LRAILNDTILATLAREGWIGSRGLSLPDYEKILGGVQQDDSRSLVMAETRTLVPPGPGAPGDTDIPRSQHFERYDRRVEMFRSSCAKNPSRSLPRATSQWKVPNAATVTIDPIGPVESQARRSIQPTRDAAVYKLKATNGFGSRGLELGVRFKPAPPAPEPPAAAPEDAAGQASGDASNFRSRVYGAPVPPTAIVVRYASVDTHHAR
jgi:hypothetical protein